jgi:8-oxo-dGTP diphosphatase
MQGYNVIAVFDMSGKSLLMCRRRKDPYRGLLNMVGGKIEPGEDSRAAAYRELFEESAIGGDDIALSHLMDYTYYRDDFRLEVWFGTLNKPVEVAGSENDLVWVGLDQDFFDMTRFAGDGNIGHIMLQIEKAGAG